MVLSAVSSLAMSTPGFVRALPSTFIVLGGSIDHCTTASGVPEVQVSEGFYIRI